MSLDFPDTTQPGFDPNEPYVSNGQAWYWDVAKGCWFVQAGDIRSFFTAGDTFPVGAPLNSVHYLTDTPVGSYMFIRDAGGDDVWVSMDQAANPVGTEDESGGVYPDGWIKKPDGTLIQWSIINLGTRIAFGSGVWGDPYRSAAVNWSFPTDQFVSIPTITTTATCSAVVAMTEAHFISIEEVETHRATNVRAIALDDSADPTDVHAHVQAIGRWK